jgi:hypothetical protein
MLVGKLAFFAGHRPFADARLATMCNPLPRQPLLCVFRSAHKRCGPLTESLPQNYVSVKCAYAQHYK